MLKIVALFLACAGAVLPTAEDAWILAGQSNMVGGLSAHTAALKAVVEAAGKKLRVITSAKGGKPIDCWINPKNGLYPDLWTRSLAGGIGEARKAGATIAGMVWYQGESDTNEPAEPELYGPRLAQLVAAVRAAAEQPTLPVIVVQLGARIGYNEKESWNWALMREIQRRSGVAFGACVTALDSVLNDNIIHLDAASHARVAARAAAAAKHLAYGGPDHGWGPQPVAVTTTSDPAVIQVRYAHVANALTLRPGWRQGFLLHRLLPPLSETLPDTAAFMAWPSLRSDAETAVGAVVAGSTVYLRFAAPVPAGAALSCGAGEDGTVGPGTTGNLPCDILADASGAQAVGFLALPITAAAVQAPAVPADAPPGFIAADRFQIGVNCFGMKSEARLPSDAAAGWGDWKQVRWNHQGRDMLTHLFDTQGRIGAVSFTTYIHRGTLAFEAPKTPDEQLMACYAENPLHVWSGLQPGRAHDLVLYFTEPARKDGKTAVQATARVVGDPWAKNHQKELAKSSFQVPCGRFSGFVRVDPAVAASTGNVVVFERIAADASGSLGIVTSAFERMNGAKEVWNSGRLAAVQIRTSP